MSSSSSPSSPGTPTSALSSTSGCSLMTRSTSHAEMLMPRRRTESLLRPGIVEPAVAVAAPEIAGQVPPLAGDLAPRCGRRLGVAEIAEKTESLIVGMDRDLARLRRYAPSSPSLVEQQASYHGSGLPIAPRVRPIHEDERDQLRKARSLRGSRRRSASRIAPTRRAGQPPPHAMRTPCARSSSRGGCASSICSTPPR